MQAYPYVYILGIGGIGMSALARWFNRQGSQVFGHDMTRSLLTDQLINEGITIHFEVAVDAIPTIIKNHPQATLVIYSPSISSKNPIWQYLTNHGYQVCKRGDVFNLITKYHYTLAIAGTHGKTTSTSLAAHILHYASKNITGFLGGIAKNYHTNFITSPNTEKEANIVIEADEFDRFFLQLHPDIAIITTVDPDHLEIYGNAQGFEEGFIQFLNKLTRKDIAILHRHVAESLLSSRHPIKAQVIQYALNDAPVHANNLKLTPAGYPCFDYISEKVIIKDIQLPMLGSHYIENALAVITACLHMGVASTIIREAIHTFLGVARRFDLIIERDDLIFLDDYGHHPVEITALLTTIRKVYPGKKITVIFRPNQHSRTRDFLVDIARSLDLADCVFLLDIYSDREVPIEEISSKSILDKMDLACKHYVANKQDLVTQFAQAGRPEVVVNLGAGDAEDFIQPIKEFLLQNYS